MGAGQSSSAGAGGAGQEVKTSYYELLGVGRHATEDELKKSYRRKALELHPDRNYGNEEAATKTFAEVQAAYEVLSDPHERAWYDSHESAILRGDDDTTGDGAAPTYQNVKMTSADDLARMVRKFNSNVTFSDAPSGFFGFVRETFEHLAQEEEVAAARENAEIPEYPTFGHKEDAYEDVVKRFYAAWSNFATVKSYSWRDAYHVSGTEERFIRRRMEQENKAKRREGVKEFNEAVRSLVAFIKKRDPRYTPSTQSEAERQKTLRDAAANQAARARAENQAKLSQEVPEWTKTRAPEEEEESEEEEVEQEVLECVACNKIFKSEKQWESHEKSKKHQKAVYALQKKMKKENAKLDLDDSEVNSGVQTPDVADEEQDILDGVAAEVEDHETKANGHPGHHNDAEEDLLGEDDQENADVAEDSSSEPAEIEKPSTTDSGEASASEDSDYASPQAVQARLQSTHLDTPTTPEAEAEDESKQADPQPKQPKMGKAAQKRAKKAAAAATNSEDSENTHKCETCEAAFPSKTRLFQHIKDHPKHAALKAVPDSGGKSRRAKGKK